MLLAWLSDGIAITIALRKTNFKIRCFQNVLLKLRWCTYIRIRLVNWQILTMARRINGSTNTYIITNSKRRESSALISCFRSLYLRNAVRKLEMIQKMYSARNIFSIFDFFQNRWNNTEGGEVELFERAISNMRNTNGYVVKRFEEKLGRATKIRKKLQLSGKAGCNFSTDPFDVCVRRFHSVENTASVTGVASRDVEFLPLLSFNYLRKLACLPAHACLLSR